MLIQTERSSIIELFQHSWGFLFFFFFSWGKRRSVHQGAVDCKQFRNSNDATNYRTVEEGKKNTRKLVPFGECVRCCRVRAAMPERVAGGGGRGEKRGAVAANGHPRGHACSRGGLVVSVSRWRPKVVRNRKPMEGREEETEWRQVRETRQGKKKGRVAVRSSNSWIRRGYGMMKLYS